MIAGQQRQNETALRRYLLGQTEGEERRFIEEKLLADQEYFDQLLRCEEELIDEYACGQMRGADKECFEKYFMASPEHRENVGFAQAFHRYLAAQKRSHAGAWTFSPRWAARTSIALMGAVVILIAALTWSMRTVMQLREQVEQNRAQLLQADQREKILTQQIEQQREQIARLREELAQLQSPVLPAGSDLVSLVLAPGMNRGDPSATAGLSSGTHRLRLSLKVGGENYPSYQVELQTAEGQVVWSRNNLKAHRSGQSQTVEFILPASLITRSDYLVVLSGTNTSGGLDKINTYHFSVIRK